MARLLLGPVLRFVGQGCATIWVETDAPCEVEVRGFTASTFCVAGHHYALVVVRDLPDEAASPYEVHLNGEQVWPETSGALADWPPSVIRTEHRYRPVRLAFGSCRVAYPEDDPTAGPDALQALARRLLDAQDQEWPDGLLFVGDQVYADDNISPQTLDFVKSRRPRPGVPDGEVNDVEEYTQLYRESWSAPAIRWLLSTVPSAMIFDDHDIRDDWNTSAAWRDQMRNEDWWHERIESGLMTYWLYQHLGNLTPDELERSHIYRAVREAEDGESVLREYVRESNAAADQPEGDRSDPDGTGGARWSFARDLGHVRLVVLDSRAGRIVSGDKREMISEADWRWLEQQLTPDALAGVDHLLIATSVPFLLPVGVHHVEAWNEATASGRWGRWFAGKAEQLRQAADLEHWAAFGSSFSRMTQLLGRLGKDGHGGCVEAPATVTFLSGDVHFAYVAKARLPDPVETSPRVFQVVCSPLRNPLPNGLRYAQRFATSRVANRIGRALARSARVPPPGIRWRIIGAPTFGNALATLDFRHRGAVATLEAAKPAPDTGHPQLQLATQALLS